MPLCCFVLWYKRPLRVPGPNGFGGPVMLLRPEGESAFKHQVIIGKSSIPKSLQRRLGSPVSLFGSLLIPFHRLVYILLHTSAGFIA